MLLRTNAAFRHLFISRIVSVLSDSIMFFTLLKWIELSSHTTGTEASSGAYTLFYIAYYLPIALLSLPIGAWISSRILQRVMLISNILRMSFIIFFVLLIPYTGYTLSYILLILLSILGLFFIPANQTLLPYLVNDEQRPQANSLLQMGYTVIKIVGQVVTAVLIQLSAPLPLLLCLSALLLALSILSIRKIQPMIKPTIAASQSNLSLMKDGIHYIARHAQLRSLFAFLAAAMFIATSIDLMLISYLTDIAHTGVEKLSYIGTASLLGMIIGAMVVPRWYSLIEKKWLIIPPLFIICIGIGSLSVIPHWLYILPIFFIQGFSLGCFNVTFVTYLQDTVASEHYTRTFSLYNMISSAMALPGVLLMGVLLRQIGVIATIQSVSLLMLLLGIIGMIFVPRLGIGQASSRTLNMEQAEIESYS